MANYTLYIKQSQRQLILELALDHNLKASCLNLFLERKDGIFWN